MPATNTQPSPKTTRARSGPTDAERAYTDACLYIGAAMARALRAGARSTLDAANRLAPAVLAGRADPQLMAALRRSHLRPRGGDTLGTENAVRQRLLKIYGKFLQGKKEGDPSKYLRCAPPPMRQAGQAVDIEAFCAVYCTPSRPNIAQAWRNAESWYLERGLKRPSVHVFRRIAKNLPETIKKRGRYTGTEWKALNTYTARDVSKFSANDIWVGDGHTFKAKIAHPIHGGPFRPEITVIMDWVSRRVMGWSVDLAESTIAVREALHK